MTAPDETSGPVAAASGAEPPPAASTAPVTGAPAASSAPSALRRRLTTLIDRPLVLGFIATIGVLGALVLGVAVGSIGTILVYIVLAMFVALGLDPIVRMLERRRLSRGGAIGIVFGGFALLVVLFAVFVLPPVIAQVVEFVAGVPETLRGVPTTDWYLALEEPWRAAVDDLLANIAAAAGDPQVLATIGGGVLAVSLGFAGFVSASFIVVALTLYFLAALPATKEAFYALAPARNRARLADFTERITGSVGSALIGSVTLAGLNAAFVFVVTLIIGLPFAAMLAVVAFVITLIPLFGSIIFLVIGTVVALFVSPLQAVIFAMCYLIYIQAESYVLSPRIMNRAIAIPAALVLIGAMVGGALMGVLGVLVALPVMASILLILREVVVPRQNAKT